MVHGRCLDGSDLCLKVLNFIKPRPKENGPLFTTVPICLGRYCEKILQACCCLRKDCTERMSHSSESKTSALDHGEIVISHKFQY